MQQPHLLEETTVYIGRWASGSTYVELADALTGDDLTYHVNLNYGPDSDLWTIVDDIMRLLVGWAELGPLGVATVHGRITRGES